ncbi:MAG: nucleotide exchange factor GrpE [Desulfobacterales bacterium]|nr:nucleotide exchange factor GrpE [Desulfobacterales bacterium]
MVEKKRRNEAGLKKEVEKESSPEKGYTGEEDKEISIDDVNDLKEKLASAQEESKETYDRLLRVSAEFENYKKRTAREITDFRKFANESILKEILVLVDNLERAVNSSDDQSNTDGCVVEGVTLTINEIQKVFDKFSVKPIDALKKPFDPNFHEAVTQEETDDHPDNIVLKEFQKGYMIHDRLLRPSMVAVSKAKENNGTKET